MKPAISLIAVACGVVVAMKVCPKQPRIPFSWPSLAMLLIIVRTIAAISLSDQAAVREQLGYIPTNLVRVASWTRNTGEPVVLQTYPLDGGSSRRKRRTEISTPFPTLYWLCHAKIHRAIAELERLGYAKTGILLTEEEIANLAECHQQYATERWESLTDEDRRSLPESIISMLRDSGIAGANITMSTPSVKCLHAHYAHYRVHGMNPVGSHVETLLRQKWPDLQL